MIDEEEIKYNSTVLHDINDIMKKDSICREHMFDVIVYVEDPHKRVGLAVFMMVNGYYCRPYGDGGLKELVRRLSLYNPYIELTYGQIMFGALAHRYNPNEHGSHDDWVRLIATQMNEIATDMDGIGLYLADKQAFREKYRSEHRIRPVINCGSNIEMFEYVALLRNDDYMFDSEERKQHGIYDNGRLFTNIETGEISYCSNLKDFNENHQLYQHLKITDIYDIFKKFNIEQNKI